jgi:hypothetical protein
MAGEMRENRSRATGKNWREGVGQIILPGAFLAFFGILWYISPVGIYPDSGSYVSMQNGREPLYPLFLAFFRFVFREPDTLVWLAGSGQLDSEKAMELITTWPALRVAMFVQSMAAGLACCYLTRVIQNTFSLSLPLTGLTGLCTLIPYVLTPLASSSHMVLNKAVLTEGLTFPLSAVFTGCMVQGLFAQEKKVRYYGAAFIWSFLLTLTRNQMLVTFAVWLAVVLFECIRCRRWKMLLFPVLGFVVFFGGRAVCNGIYNGLTHEGYTGAATGSYNLLTTLLYLSDREDSALLMDEAQRRLFLEMHDQMETEGMTRAYAPDGILNQAYHYEEYYDRIGFEIQQPCLFDYARAQGIPDGEALNYVVGIASQMDRVLFPALAGAYLSNYTASVLSGLTRSVAASGMIMGIYAACMYALAVALTICLLRRDRSSRGALLMLFALLMICANVCATALMIMCLSRYMIYHTALFYIAGLMCLVEAAGPYMKKRKDKSHGL